MIPRLIRIVLVALAVLILVPLLYVGLTLFRAGGGLPQWQASLDLPALDRTVEVVRDSNGIPHIFASTEHDAFFAQGFVHAQDRLFQMLVARQQLSGRLSEWFGAGALRGDRLNRAFRYADFARAEFETMPDEDRALLAAYADGVNAYLGSDVYKRPPEMVVLHIQPERWEPHDSLVVYKGVYTTLMSFGWELENRRYELLAKDPRASGWLEAVMFGVHPIVDDGSTGQATVQPFKDKAFSDSWLLTGEHTATGKPLLANDPQLPSTLPSFWYLSHQSIDGDNRVGGTLPGIPFFGVGRTDNIAWSVTNGFVDQADMMLMHCDPENPGRYRRSESDDWQAFEAREEVFDVRFGAAVRETFYTTPSGVVFPQELLLLPVTDDPDACIEVRLVYMDGDSSLSALLRLNRAQTTAQAYEALRIFTGPSLNFTLADTKGDVGYVSAGRYYIREGDAATIIDYAPRDSMNWSPIGYEENPHTLSPLRGRIVTANQPAVGADYPHYLSDIWAAPFRAMRIHELLDANQTHDVETYLAMQRDTLSIPARRAVPRLLEAVSDDVGGVQAEMTRVLRNWDYRFTPDSPAPVVFLTWLHVFHEQVARDELGDLLWQRVSREALPPIVYQVLEGRHTDWCATLGEPGPGDCDALLVQSLDEAAARLEEALGPEPENWQWGQAAASTHPHQGFAGIPILDGMFSRTSHIPGGPDTLMVNYTDVRQAPHFPASGFASSLQAIYDLADLEQSQFMLSTGQSGHFRSPYYDNFLPRFAAGERFTIPTDRDRIEPVATLILRSSQSEQ